MGVVAAPTSAVAVPNATVAVSTSEVGITQSVVGLQQQDGGGKGGAGNSNADAEQDLANDPRLAKFSLTVQCDSESSYAQQVHGKLVVLRNGKLYLDDLDPEKQQFPDGHPFSGFYIEYPVEEKPQPLGLVSTISKEPPLLNWIYVDTNTLELKYGNKTQSRPHIFAPWDWTEDQQALTLDGWEGFVVMEETSGSSNWILGYDRDDDLLQSVKGDRVVLECRLQRHLLQNA